MGSHLAGENQEAKKHDAREAHYGTSLMCIIIMSCKTLQWMSSKSYNLNIEYLKDHSLLDVFFSFYDLIQPGLRYDLGWKYDFLHFK